MSVAADQFAQGLEQLIRQAVAEQDKPVAVIQPPEEVLTIAEMAKRLGIGKETAYEWIGRPGFPVYDLGERQKRVIWSDVIEWVRSHKPQ